MTILYGVVKAEIMLKINPIEILNKFNVKLFNNDSYDTHILLLYAFTPSRLNMDWIGCKHGTLNK